MSCSGDPRDLHSFPTRRSSDLHSTRNKTRDGLIRVRNIRALNGRFNTSITHAYSIESAIQGSNRSEERFSRNAETDLVCRLLLEKKKTNKATQHNRITR